MSKSDPSLQVLRLGISQLSIYFASFVFVLNHLILSFKKSDVNLSGEKEYFLRRIYNCQNMCLVTCKVVCYNSAHKSKVRPVTGQEKGMVIL